MITTVANRVDDARYTQVDLDQPRKILRWRRSVMLSDQDWNVAQLPRKYHPEAASSPEGLVPFEEDGL